jgi:hypothetical protein
MGSDRNKSNRHLPQFGREIVAKPSSLRYHFAEYGSATIVHDLRDFPDKWKKGRRTLPIGMGYVIFVPKEKITGDSVSLNRELYLLKVDPRINETLMQNWNAYRECIRSYSDKDVIKAIYGNFFNVPTKGNLPDTTAMVPISDSGDISDIAFPESEQTFPNIRLNDSELPHYEVEDLFDDHTDFIFRFHKTSKGNLKKIVSEFDEFMGQRHKLFELHVDLYEWTIPSDLLRVGFSDLHSERPNYATLSLEVTVKNYVRCSLLLPRCGVLEWDGLSRSKAVISKPPYAMTQSRIGLATRVFSELYKLTSQYVPALESNGSPLKIK